MECSGLTAQVKALTAEQMELYSYMPERKCDCDDGIIRAPITGKITKMKVKPGDKVKAGQHLFSIEAMKMENVVMAEKDFTIKELLHQVGDLVNVGEKVVVG